MPYSLGIAHVATNIWCWFKKHLLNEIFSLSCTFSVSCFFLHLIIIIFFWTKWWENSGGGQGSCALLSGLQGWCLSLGRPLGHIILVAAGNIHRRPRERKGREYILMHTRRPPTTAHGQPALVKNSCKANRRLSGHLWWGSQCLVQRFTRNWHNQVLLICSVVDQFIHPFRKHPSLPIKCQAPWWALMVDPKRSESTSLIPCCSQSSLEPTHSTLAIRCS